MKQNPLTIVLFLTFFLSVSSTFAKETIKPSVRYHQGREVVSTTTFEGKSGVTVTDTKGCRWVLNTEKRQVQGDATARDYTYTWKLIEDGQKTCRLPSTLR